MGKIKYLLQNALILLIHCYRLFVSPYLRPSCRFEPSCSSYAVDAIKTHGILKGGCYTLYRLIRCQPLCKGGFDPVPYKTRDKYGL